MVTTNTPNLSEFSGGRDEYIRQLYQRLLDLERLVFELSELHDITITSHDVIGNTYPIIVKEAKHKIKVEE